MSVDKMGTDGSDIAIQTKQAAEHAYGVLERLIIRNKLGPGERINVDSLSAKMGISRSPIVYALQRLQAEGLVRVEPRRGVFVRELSLNEVSELFDVRLALELYGLSRASLMAGEEVMRELGSLAASMEVTAEGDMWIEYDRMIRLDREFHYRMMEPLRNKYLLKVYNNLSIQWQVSRSFYRSKSHEAKSVLAEHRELLRAYEARDAEALQRAVTIHSEGTRARVARRLEQTAGQASGGRAGFHHAS
jgi:DNA-binding GntR family transcriptional regulator